MGLASFQGISHYLSPVLQNLGISYLVPPIQTPVGLWRLQRRRAELVLKYKHAETSLSVPGPGRHRVSQPRFPPSSQAWGHSRALAGWWAAVARMENFYWIDDTGGYQIWSQPSAYNATRVSLGQNQWVRTPYYTLQKTMVLVASYVSSGLADPRHIKRELSRYGAWAQIRGRGGLGTSWNPEVTSRSVRWPTWVHRGCRTTSALQLSRDVLI